MISHNSQNLGIQAHFNHLLNSLKVDPNKPPTSQLLVEINKLQTILKEKQVRVESSISLQQQLTHPTSGKPISREQLLNLQQLQNKLKENEQILKIVKICREIDIALVNFQDKNMHMTILSGDRNNFIEKLSKKDTIFKEIYNLISVLDDQINTIISDRDKLKSKSPTSNKYHYRDSVVPDKSYQSETEIENIEVGKQLLELRNRYLRQLKNNIYVAIIKNYYTRMTLQESKETYHEKLEQAFSYFHLPIKPKVKDAECHNVEVFYSNFITEALFTEYCYYCLKKRIQYIIDEQNMGGERNDQFSKEVRNSGVSGYVESKSDYQSPFFSQLWKKIIKSVGYIFMNKGGDYLGFNEENSGYQIDEPGWMFEYLYNAFLINFQYITKNIIPYNFPIADQLDGQTSLTQVQQKYALTKLNHENQKLIRQFTQQIQVYFLGYNIQSLFLSLTLHRFQTDIISLVNSGNLYLPGYNFNKKMPQNNKAITQEEQKKRKQVSFIFFNFLDELYSFQNKVALRFDTQINLIQTFLKVSLNPDQYLINSKLPSVNILSYSFEYEQEWIQQRIFKEFYNINYSNISDLRNIESYNIVINFIQLFDKLYIKYKQIKEEGLQKQINSFYSETILKLVRHIKSSFKKIYMYNTEGLDRFQILMGFKKVQEQFRGYFDGFLKSIAGFEAQIQEEYYSVYEEICVQYAESQLNQYHKKLYKLLSQLSQTFQSSEKVEEKRIQKWGKINEQWSKKIEKINKLHMRRASSSGAKGKVFVDGKLKNIFFVYLQSTVFSLEGYKIFMDLFEPYLVTIYGRDNYKLLRMLIEMEKATFKEYLNTHKNTISFLNGSEIKSIEKSQMK